MKMINVSTFKTQYLALIEEVVTTGEPVTILQDGHPVAQLVPLPVLSGPFPQTTLQGTVRIQGDIEAPVLPSDAWEAEGAPQP